MQISTQLANSTAPAYQYVDFEIPRYAITVNALLFASLCCSLIAALAGVISLQWVSEYDARLDTVDARKHALIRHFRFLGVQKWNMGGIIAILPLLLHASVFLFFSGMVVWMGHRHFIIFLICGGGLALAIVFYAVTVTVAVTVGNAPFRSPMGRALRPIIFTLIRVPIFILYVIYLLLYLIGPMPRLTGLYGALSNLNFKIRDAFSASSRIEAKATKEIMLESQLVAWTIAHVEIAPQSLNRLLHILNHAQRMFISKHGLFLDQIFQEAVESLLKSFATRELSDGDVHPIRVLVNIWATRHLRSRMQLFYREEPLSIQEDPTGVQGRDRDTWQAPFRLIGLLDYRGTLPESALVTVTKLISINAFKEGPQSLQQLKEVSACLLDRSNPPNGYILRYAVSSLSVYLWTQK